MTPFQHLWVAACSVGPGLVLALMRSWWLGILGFIAVVAIGGVVSWVVVLCELVPMKCMGVFGYAKSIGVAALVLWLGLTCF